MIFKFGSVVLLAHFTLSSYFNRVHSSDDSSIDILDGPGNMAKYSSSALSSGCKRKSGEPSESGLEMKKTPLKYRNAIRPIKLGIDDEYANNLRDLERKLEFQGTDHKWEKYRELKREMIEPLCKAVWQHIIPQIQADFEVAEDMARDCDGALVLGPSNKSHKSRIINGYFRYLPKDKKRKFFADLLRCNCALLESKGQGEEFKTIRNSKKFFYLLKWDEDEYYILTIHGKLNSRRVKIVGHYTKNKE